MKKLIRSATVACSLNTFCRGMLRELSADYEVVALSSPGTELSEMAQREQVRTIAVEMERHISPIKDVVSLCRLVRVLRRERPDILHSMTPKAGLLCMMAAWMAHVPVRIHTFTGLVFPTSKGLKRRLLMLTDALTCACATHVIAEGHGVRNDLLNFGITRKPVRVLGYGNVRGIDLVHYDRTDEVARRGQEIREEIGATADSFVFVTVGRLVNDKGIRELVEAFRRLLGTHPEAHLLLVGDEEPQLDPLPSDTKAAIEACPQIHAVGNQSDVRPYYAAANALVHPSYREGFPNVVIEAGAMRLPCIVTDINGSREIIVNTQNGIIVPPHDAGRLYAAMSWFVNTPSLVSTLAANARPMVAERFEQGFVRQCLKDFYKEITSSCTSTQAM